MRLSTELVLFVSVLACATLGPLSSGICADAASGNTIAILDFNAINTSTGDAVAISNFVRQAVFRNKTYRVVDKGNMDRILAEQAFQQTGCTNQECAVKLGKVLNVRKIVVGSYTLLGSVNYLTAQLVEVETGELISSAKEKGFSIENADEAADRLVGRLLGGAVTAPQVERRGPREGSQLAGSEKPRRKVGLEALFFGGTFPPPEDNIVVTQQRVLGAAIRVWPWHVGLEARVTHVYYKWYYEGQWFSTGQTVEAYGRLSGGIRARYAIGPVIPSVGVAISLPLVWESHPQIEDMFMVGAGITVTAGERLLIDADVRRTRNYMPITVGLGVRW